METKIATLRQSGRKTPFTTIMLIPALSLLVSACGNGTASTDESSDTQTGTVNNDASTSLNLANSTGSGDFSSVINTDIGTDLVTSSTRLETEPATSTGGSDTSNQPGGQIMGKNLNRRLRNLIGNENIKADPSIGLVSADIDSPIAQLGMKLFFSKSLGGEMDSACVSCHHPSLAGADSLSLGVGVHALDDSLLGPGRLHLQGEFPVPRNAPSTFNSSLYQSGMFWDSRIEALDSGIRTPDSALNEADPLAGSSLLAAQAGFPVTSIEEMRTNAFETDQSNQTVRDHLAARIGGFDGGFNATSELEANTWVPEFQSAFGSSESAERLITYENIATALAEYERSQIFIDSPWKSYIDGNDRAINNAAKHGAMLFFTAKEDGGGDCSRCHSGAFFSDEEHHVVAFPQIGPGKGDGNTGNADFGRERETGELNDRHKFRTPSLLNVANTAPYGHTGAYASLRDVLNHYNEPENAIEMLDQANWCNGIPQFAQVSNCDETFPNAATNTRDALNTLDQQSMNESIKSIDLSNVDISHLLAFLQTLTDPCIDDRECLSPWIPEPGPGPDGMQLNGVDRNGNAL